MKKLYFDDVEPASEAAGEPVEEAPTQQEAVESSDDVE